MDATTPGDRQMGASKKSGKTAFLRQEIFDASPEISHGRLISGTTNRDDA